MLYGGADEGGPDSGLFLQVALQNGVLMRTEVRSAGCCFIACVGGCSSKWPCRTACSCALAYGGQAAVSGCSNNLEEVGVLCLAAKY